MVKSVTTLQSAIITLKNSWFLKLPYNHCNDTAVTSFKKKIKIVTLGGEAPWRKALEGD